MLTASSRRPALAVVAAATVLGVVVGTVIAFVAGGTGGRGQDRAAPAVTTTTLPREFYTVVLASIAADSPDGQAEAGRRAERFRARGIEVGLLNSSDYGSLNAGYLVVYSGHFPSEGAAQ